MAKRKPNKPVPKLSKAQAEAFVSLVQKAGADECWPWAGTIGTYGYGQFRLPGKKYRLAHRMAYALATGRDPGPLCVLHRCDNPPCCNPKHLFLGTVYDNKQDEIHKGRKADKRMENNSRAILTRAQAETIRHKYATTGASFTELAVEYGVSAGSIGVIVQGRGWGFTTHAAPEKAAQHTAARPTRKLTAESVREIRATPWAYGVALRLARKYGVTERAIAYVRTGQSWKWVV